MTRYTHLRNALRHRRLQVALLTPTDDDAARYSLNVRLAQARLHEFTDKTLLDLGHWPRKPSEQGAREPCSLLRRQAW